MHIILYLYRGCSRGRWGSNLYVTVLQPIRFLNIYYARREWDGTYTKRRLRVERGIEQVVGSWYTGLKGKSAIYRARV